MVERFIDGDDHFPGLGQANQRAVAGADVDFSFVAVLFDGEDHLGFKSVAENFADLGEAGFDFFADGGSNFVVSSRVFHVHERPLVKFLIEMNWALHLKSEVRSKNAEVKSLAPAFSTLAIFDGFCFYFCILTLTSALFLYSALRPIRSLRCMGSNRICLRRTRCHVSPSFLHSTLVRARYPHVFAVLGYRAAGHLDALRLQDAGDLLVGERTAGIFFVDELFDAALENQQRSVAAFGPLHALAEKVAQLEHALRSVGIFAGYSAAYCGRMHADFFGHLLDHHGFQLVNASFQKILLARDDAITNLGDGLLALLDILDELDRALVTLFHVVAGGLVVAAVAGNKLFVGRIQAKLGQVFVVHDHQPLVAMLHESNVGLDEARLGFVVTQAGAGIERSDVIQCIFDRLQRTADGSRDFFVLLILQGAQMLIDDRGGVLENLRRAVAVSFSVLVAVFLSVLVQRELLLVIAQLVEQALAEIAATNAGGVELADRVQGLLQ